MCQARRLSIYFHIRDPRETMQHDFTVIQLRRAHFVGDEPVAESLRTTWASCEIKTRKLTKLLDLHYLTDFFVFSECLPSESTSFTSCVIPNIWVGLKEQGRKRNSLCLTFFLTRDMTPMRVRTGCRHKPSLGTPSANVSAPSATGSHKWRIKRDTYALAEKKRAETYGCKKALLMVRFNSGFTYLNSFSVLPLRSRTSHWEEKASWDGIPQRITAFRKAFRWRVLKPSTYQ